MNVVSNESIGTIRLWFIVISLVITFSFGGFGNIISIIIFNNKSFKKQATTVYLQASFLLSILILLYSPIMYLAPIWNVNNINCKIYFGILIIITEIKSWFQTIGSFDRLISVTNPHRFRFKNKFEYQLTFMISIALILIFFILPNLIFYTSVTIKNITICSFPLQQDSKWISFYSGVEYLVFRTVLPFIIMVTSSCIVTWKIYKSKNQLMPNADRKNEINLFKSLISIDLFIVLFQIPSFIHIFESSNANYFHTMKFSIFYTVSLIDNVFLFQIFVICNREYRKLFFKYIKCKCCKNNNVEPN